MTEGEYRYIQELARDENLSKLILRVLFKIPIKREPDTGSYPGWDVVETGEKFILISKTPPPLGRTSPVLLLPKDKEYEKISKI